MLSESKFLLKEGDLSRSLFEFELKRGCCEFVHLLEGAILVTMKVFLQLSLHPLDKAVVVIVLGLVACPEVPLLLPPPPLKGQQFLLVALPLAPQPLHFALPLLYSQAQLLHCCVGLSYEPDTVFQLFRTSKQWLKFLEQTFDVGFG